MALRMLRIVLALAVAVAVAAGVIVPASAQTAPPPNNPGGRDNSATGAAIGIGITILAPLVVEGIRRARANAQEDDPPPQTRRTPPPVRNQIPRQPASVQPRGPVYVALPDPAPLPPQFPQQQPQPGDDAQAPFRPNEVVMVLAPGAGPDAAAQIAGDFDLNILRETEIVLTGQRLVVMSIPDARGVTEVENALAGDARTTATQKNFLYVPSQDQAKGSMAGGQYALAALNVGKAHEVARGSGIVIAVIDSRIDIEHPELTGSIAGNYDAAGYGIDTADPHGTSIAGIIAADGALVGIAPDASILAVRAFWKDSEDAPTTSSTEALVRGVDWAVGQGARVLNLSFTGPRDPLLADVLAEVRRRGIVMVAAAGNNGPDAGPAYPGALESVIAVTATDKALQLFSQANRGAYIDVAAPGVDILSPAPGGRYQTISGTSMATAHVSGLAALLLESTADQALLPDAVQTALQDAAQDLGAPGLDPEFGAGQVDAAALFAARARSTASEQ